MKKILVPTDFTDLSYLALSSAASLANKLECEIDILHVFSKEPDPDAESLLSGLQKAEYMKGISSTYRVISGDPIEGIVDTDADLIVIAGREIKGIKGFFSHTTAEKVAKKARCPVITVKQHTNLSNIKSIVYATDMRSEQNNLIPSLKELQEMYDAHLHLVKVYDDHFLLEKKMEKRLRDFAEFNKLDSYSVTAIEGTDEAEEIMWFASNLGAQMIAMATHDRQGLEKLVGGFISGEILKEAKMAIWTMRVD